MGVTEQAPSQMSSTSAGLVASPAAESTSTWAGARRASGWIIRRGIVPVLIIGVWILVAQAHLVGSIFVPPPSDIWSSFRGMAPLLPSAIRSSVVMTLVGFVIGSSFGTLMGLCMSYSRFLREVFGGLLDFVRPIPIFALIPLFVLWFGIGIAPQIALIALGTSIIMGVTTIEATRNVPPVYVRAALMLGANRRTIFRTVVVPWIFPHLLGALRVAAAASWGLDVAAELMGAQSGLGYIMIVRQQYLDTAGIIVVVLIYSLLALALDILIRNAERPFTRWTERETNKGGALMVGLQA